jgi:hypothetical protein
VSVPWDRGIAIDDNASALRLFHGWNTPFVDGRKVKLHMPPNVPVKDFWAVTLYDTQTRSMLQTSQKFPTVGSETKGIEKNADGSYDV